MTALMPMVAYMHAGGPAEPALEHEERAEQPEHRARGTDRRRLPGAEVAVVELVDRVREASSR